MTHEEIDKIIQEIIDEDPIWKKCYPCQENGICCKGADIPISSEESEEIKKFLSEHNEIFLYAKLQKEKNKLCLFYNPCATKCLIHDIRPLICRVTPIKGEVNEDSNTIKVYTPKNGFPCNNMSTENKIIIRRDGRKIYTEDGRIYFNINQIVSRGQSWEYMNKVLFSA